MKIYISKADIEEARRLFETNSHNRTNTCPIACALRRKFKADDVFVGSTIQFNGRLYYHSKSSLKFMHDADELNDNVKPKVIYIKI